MHQAPLNFILNAYLEQTRHSEDAKNGARAPQAESQFGPAQSFTRKRVHYAHQHDNEIEKVPAVGEVASREERRQLENGLHLNNFEHEFAS